MAFFGGSTGVIYRQFSITIISAMGLSILVALVLTPALCATLLKPIPKAAPHSRPLLHLLQPRLRLAHRALPRGARALFALGARRCSSMAASSSVLALLFLRLPTASCRKKTRASCSFSSAARRAPPSARTLAVRNRSSIISTQDEGRHVDTVFVVAASASRARARTPACLPAPEELGRASGTANRAPAIARRAMKDFQHPRRAGLRARAARRCTELGQYVGLRPRTGRPRRSRP